MDDAQGQGGLGVQLLKGVQHLQINIRPRLALNKTNLNNLVLESNPTCDL